MTTTLVHEWIERSGGAERVLDALAKEFPRAPIACLWDTSGGRYSSDRVKQSALRVLHNNKAMALPFMPLAWARLSRRKRSEDRLIISSHLFAHHVRGGAGTRVFVYVHTPARYLWTPDEDPRGRSLLAKAFGGLFRHYDKQPFPSPGASYVANSRYVAERIRRTWGFEPQVIYPPVATERLQAVEDWSAQLNADERGLMDRLEGRFILGASRLVAYKEMDVVISAGEQAGLPVVIAGRGPELPELQRLAARVNVPVHFLDEPSDELLYALYQRCAAYVFPPVEDFGIMPVEAMAVGARVIVNSEGGGAESVEDGVSGVHWHRDRGETFPEAFERLATLDPDDARARARFFSEDRFRREVREWVS